jgi:hypothetical protein
MGIARNVHDHAAARCIAESAIVNTVSQIATDTDWRKHVANGQWSSKNNYLGGGVQIYGYDGEDTTGDGIIEGDGVIDDDTADPVTLWAIGIYGNASHKVTVVLHPPGGPAPDFEIDGGGIIAKEPVQARVVSIGSALGTGWLNYPVTVRIRIGDQLIEPFGGFLDPVNADLNDGSGDQPVFQLPEIYGPNTVFTVEARSWQKKSIFYSGNSASHWKTLRNVNSADNTPLVKVLRNGDAVPAVQGWGSQADAAEYIADYIDSDTNTISIADHQAILLFELYTDDVNDATADFQDLVVMVNLGRPGEEIPGDGGGSQSGGGANGKYRPGLSALPARSPRRPLAPTAAAA